MTAEDIVRQFSRLIFEALASEEISDPNGLYDAAVAVLNVVEGVDDPLVPTARRVARRALKWLDSGDPADYKKLYHAARVFGRSSKTSTA